MKKKKKREAYRILWPAALFIIAVILIISVTKSNTSHKPEITSDLKEYNLIVITIDALRADHLGCYGYSRNTSPFIDSLADEGIIFENAFSNSSYTRESVAVLFTGRLPSGNGCTGWLGTPPTTIKSMGQLFQEAGYQTALLSSSHQLKHRHFHTGFNQVEVLSSKWGISGNGPKLTARAAAFAEKNRDRKFFMYLHYLDPHGPYDPPPEFYKRFKNKIFPRPLFLYKDVRKKCHLLIQEGFGPGEDRFEDLVLRYDAEIAFVDRSIESLFRRLRELNLHNNTLVVITADHGEEFLEHDFVEHAWTLYNESLHVPLIFWAPGMIAAERIDSMVSTVDILPTLLHLKKIPHQRDDLDGTSLFQYKNGELFFTPPTKPFITETLIQHRSLIRAIVKDNRKYIAARRWLTPQQRPGVLPRTKEIELNPEFHLDIWGPIVHEEFFDLSADPGETRSLPLDKKGRELREILAQYEADCQQNGSKPDQSSEKKTPPSKKDLEKLKTLGYL